MGITILLMIFDIFKLFIIWYVLSDLTNFIGELISEISNTKNKAISLLQHLITYVLICYKCSSFWGSLIMSGGDIFISAIVALAVDWIKSRKDNKTDL